MRNVLRAVGLVQRFQRHSLGRLSSSFVQLKYYCGTMAESAGIVDKVKELELGLCLCPEGG